MAHLKKAKVELTNVTARRGRRWGEMTEKAWLGLMHVRAAAAAEQGQEVAESV